MYKEDDIEIKPRIAKWVTVTHFYIAIGIFVFDEWGMITTNIGN